MTTPGSRKSSEWSAPGSLLATLGSTQTQTTHGKDRSRHSRSELASTQNQPEAPYSSLGYSFPLEKWVYPDQVSVEGLTVEEIKAWFQERLTRWQRVFDREDTSSLAMNAIQSPERPYLLGSPYTHSPHLGGYTVQEASATPTGAALGSPPDESNSQLADLPKETATGTSGDYGESATRKSISGFTHQTPTSATSQGSLATAKKLGISYLAKVFDPVDEAPNADPMEEISSASTDSTGESDDISNGGMPTESFEERLANPREYFRKLELLEESIYLNSALCSQVSSATESQFQVPFPKYEILKDTDPQMFAMFRNARVVRHEQQIDGIRIHLLHLRNVILSIYLNLVRLQVNRYCQDFISLLVMDPSRPRHVAKLVRLPVSNVKQLTIAFIFACSENANDPTRYFYLNKECKNIHSLMGFPSISQFSEARSHNSLEWPEDQSATEIYLWHCVVHTLDLAILSYSGAHIENFDETYLGARKESFEIPDQFLVSDEFKALQTENVIFSPFVCLRRRSLQCLDNFLHRDVWVFHPLPESQKHDNKLYLQTDITTFADIWGPLWASSRKSKPHEIYEFNVGNGTILAWPYNQDQNEQALPSADEVFCHWVSRGEPLPDIKLLQKNLVKRHLHVWDKLLIGASPKSLLELKLNDNCQRSLVDIKQDLNYIHALNHLRTARRDRVKDSQTVGITAGGLGVSAGASKTYKRRDGQTWKNALVESWRDLEFVNPISLGYYVGLEISLCTRNARRIRLLDVLRTQTMALYLKGRDFRWGKWGGKLEEKYFKALKSPKAFHNLWKARKYREIVGKAISRCLDALAETGVDEMTGALNALWAVKADTPGLHSGRASVDGSSSENQSPSDQSRSDSGSDCSDDDELTLTEEYIMSLFRSEHTWTRFLKDTRDTLTMAVVEDNCLEFNHEHGRLCTSDHIAEDGKLFRWKANGYPVLQTRLEINERLLDKEGMVKKESEGTRPYWDVRSTEKKTRFRLGEQGVLDVFENPNFSCPSKKGKKKMTTKSNGETQPLVVEWYGVKSETLREVTDVDIQQTFYGLNPKEHHTEYSSTALPIRPIPIFILSNSREISRLG